MARDILILLDSAQRVCDISLGFVVQIEYVELVVYISLERLPRENRSDKDVLNKGLDSLEFRIPKCFWKMKSLFGLLLLLNFMSRFCFDRSDPTARFF